MGPMAWVGHVIGFLPLLHVERLDVNEPPRAPVEVAATVEYGATIGMVCTGCHGADLAGMSDPTGVAPNLTLHPSGLGDGSYESFDTALRTGELPDGSTMGESMPWQMTARLTDVEMQALWAYLSDLEPLPSVVQ